MRTIFSSAGWGGRGRHGGVYGSGCRPRSLYLRRSWICFLLRPGGLRSRRRPLPSAGAGPARCQRSAALGCCRAGSCSFAVEGFDQWFEALVSGLVLVLLERGDAGGQAKAGFNAQAVMVVGALDELLCGVCVLGGLRDGQVPRSRHTCDAGAASNHCCGSHFACHR